MNTASFRDKINRIAPRLARRIDTLTFYQGVCTICIELGITAPKDTDNIPDSLDRIWDHIVATGWKEKPWHEIVTQKEMIGTFAGQLHTLAMRGKRMQQILVNQVAYLAAQEQAEIELVVEEQERDALGWSSW